MRASSQTIARTLFSIFDMAQSGKLNDTQLEQLFCACFFMSSDAPVDSETQKDYFMVAKDMVASTQKLKEVTSNVISQTSLLAWINSSTPLLYTIFSAWMSRKCFDSLPTRIVYTPPQMSHRSDIISRYVHVVSHFRKQVNVY